MFSKIGALWRVLKAGEELSHAAAWKNRQNATNLLVGLVGAFVALLPLAGIRLDVSDADLAVIAGGIAALGGVFNAYLTTATSRKVGLPAARPDPDPEPPDNLMG